MYAENKNAPQFGYGHFSVSLFGFCPKGVGVMSKSLIGHFYHQLVISTFSSLIYIYIFFYKVVELVGGGYVINEAYPV